MPITMGVFPREYFANGSRGIFIEDNTMQQYWPGTRVPKSRNNAFDWRGKPSEVFQTISWKTAQAAAVSAEKAKGKTVAFTIYSKARAAK